MISIKRSQIKVFRIANLHTKLKTHLLKHPFQYNLFPSTQALDHT